MSYQVLARKWRPAKFEQVVGQSHVLHALTNALSQQRLHHAYLFTGTRGVGKTSLARLFAKGLNCEQGVTAIPCGQCSSCAEIAQGRFVDLIEVDAASRTKVDDTREILDNVQYRPTRGRYKVYLIDEVHMLSRSSFNALLKTLEEPPEHVKFLLATTDPQKLPITVLSRCLQFNLKSLTQDDIGKQLRHVLTQEKLPFEDAALSLLAKAANGSMRDALSLTDQAIAFGAGEIMLKQVQTMLGSIDEQHVLGLLAALTTGNVAELMPACTKVISFGAEPEEVLRSLLELLHQITLTQFAPAAAQLSLYSEQIKAFAQQLSPEQVQLYYQILVSGRKEIAYAPDPKSGLEMALLRAVAFVPQQQVTRWETEQGEQVQVAIPDVAPVAAVSRSAQSQPQATTAITSEQAQPTVADEQTVSVDNDDEQELEAEQALLLSQAQSQGFQQQDQELTAHESNFESAVQEPTPATDTAVTPTHNQVEVLPDKPEIPPSMDIGDDLLGAVLANRDALRAEIDSNGAETDKTKEGVVKKRKLELKRRDSAGITDPEAQVPAAENAPIEQSIALDDTPPWLDSNSAQVKGLTTTVGCEQVSEKQPVEPEQTEVVTGDNIGKSTDENVTEALSQVNSKNQAVITGDSTDLYWYKLMSKIEFGGRIRQLAVNSVCQQLGKSIVLLLKPDQKHLAAASAVSQLNSALAKYFNTETDVKIDVGIDNKRETPLEIRKRFQTDLLNEAQQKLLADVNVQWLSAQMGASLVADSVAYSPTNLALKAESIADLDFNKV
ncbi:MAG: DNA polymerase III subunit gamma/tau [Parashewanella sp.]